MFESPLADARQFFSPQIEDPDRLVSGDTKTQRKRKEFFYRIYYQVYEPARYPVFMQKQIRSISVAV
jgi:hypothetical protein